MDFILMPFEVSIKKGSKSVVSFEKGSELSKVSFLVRGLGGGNFTKDPLVEDIIVDCFGRKWV